MVWRLIIGNFWFEIQKMVHFWCCRQWLRKERSIGNAGGAREFASLVTGSLLAACLVSLQIASKHSLKTQKAGLREPSDLQIAVINLLPLLCTLCRYFLQQIVNSNLMLAQVSNPVPPLFIFFAVRYCCYLAMIFLNLVHLGAAAGGGGLSPKGILDLSTHVAFFFCM